jgi:hypothetical protein
MALAAREHRAAVVEVEMSGPQKLDADQPDIALAHDLLSKKAPVFAHLEEVLGDHTLTLAAKRSLLASWASDALGVEDSPSLRQLPSGPSTAFSWRIIHSFSPRASDGGKYGIKHISLERHGYSLDEAGYRPCPRRLKRNPGSERQLGQLQGVGFAHIPNYAIIHLADCWRNSWPAATHE